MGILCTPIVNWDLKNLKLCEMKAAGTAAMNTTLDNAAAADKGGGEVRIPCTGHGFKQYSHIGIRGSTAYNGTFIISDADPESDSNYFNIYTTYTAEDFAGTETLRPELDPEVMFQVLDFRLHLGAAGGASENFKIQLDSGQPAGSLHDWVPLDLDMELLTDVHLDWSKKLMFFNNNDKFVFTYPNTGGPQNWGLEAKYLVTQ